MASDVFIIVVAGLVSLLIANAVVVTVKESVLDKYEYEKRYKADR